MLDSADIARLHASGQPAQAVQDATVVRLGEFSTKKLIPPSQLPRFIEYCSASGLEGPSTEGVLPVVYMDPVIFSSGPQCKFAVEKPGSAGGLLCSVGPKYMPTACVLYPYGEFVPVADVTHLQSSRTWAGLPTALQDSLRTTPAGQDMVYTLDHTGCEGVSACAPAAPAAPHQLEVYERSNSLRARRQQYLQWLFLLQAVANMNLIETLQQLDAAVFSLPTAGSRRQRRVRRQGTPPAGAPPPFATGDHRGGGRRLADWLPGRTLGALACTETAPLPPGAPPPFATAAFVGGVSSLLYGLPGSSSAPLPCTHTSPLLGGGDWGVMWPQLHDRVRRLALRVQEQLQCLGGGQPTKEVAQQAVHRVIKVCQEELGAR